MNPIEIFINSYKQNCLEASEEPNCHLIQNALENNDKKANLIKLSFQNEFLTHCSFAPLGKSFNLSINSIYYLDLSFNSLFKDNSFKMLENFLQNSEILQYLNLEKTNLTDFSGTALIKMLPKMKSLLALNISSNLFTMPIFTAFSELFKNNQISLENLNLSNSKLNDKIGSELIESIIKYSKIQTLNLSRNLLKYKTGAYLMTLINSNIKLKSINLSYNNLSSSLIQTIDSELSKFHKINTVSDFKDKKLSVDPLLMNKLETAIQKPHVPQIVNIKNEEDSTLSQSSSQNANTKNNLSISENSRNYTKIKNKPGEIKCKHINRKKNNESDPFNPSNEEECKFNQLLSATNSNGYDSKNEENLNLDNKFQENNKDATLRQLDSNVNINDKIMISSENQSMNILNSNDSHPLNLTNEIEFSIDSNIISHNEEIKNICDLDNSKSIPSINSSSEGNTKNIDNNENLNIDKWSKDSRNSKRKDVNNQIENNTISTDEMRIDSTIKRIDEIISKNSIDESKDFQILNQIQENDEKLEHQLTFKSQYF